MEQDGKKLRWYAGPLLFGFSLAAAALTMRVAPLRQELRKPDGLIVEILIDGKPVPNLQVQLEKLDDLRQEAEPGIIGCFERGGDFFIYGNQRQSFGYYFDVNDLLHPGGVHPIYGGASGTITTNPNMNVILEIPKPVNAKIEKIFIGDEDYFDKGTLSPIPPERDGRIRYSMVTPNDSVEIVYWKGQLNLKPGDNPFHPVVRFDDTRWSGVGVDWRYITYFSNVEQARAYAQSPRRAFNGYGGEDPNKLRDESEREMTSKLNAIIDEAIKEGRL